ncbi:MAG: RNA polymerase sigma factor [Rhodospirillaceae bacterium]|jgi:RNA polymerase sigma-70 factor, ECF subfamily
MPEKLSYEPYPEQPADSGTVELSPVSDLINSAIAGNRNAFTVLFDQHYELIYRIAFQMVRTQSDAEDIAQDTCIKMARKLHTYKFEANFTTWLYRLTQNTAKDWLRKAYRKHERPLPEGFDMAANMPSPERQAAARETLGLIDQLPRKIKAAVLLVFRDGLSHREAADTLGCAETTVSWRIHQARKILSDTLQPDDTARPTHA